MDISQVLWTISTSIFDVGSDFINSLDFLGYNISTTIVDSIAGSTNTTDEYIVHQKWGYASLSIIFLPGLAMLPAGVLNSLSIKKWGPMIVCIILVPTYPLAMLVAEVALIYHTCTSRGKGRLVRVQHVEDQNANFWFTFFFLGTEAFVESFWQMVLQGHTILYGYEVTKVQIVSVFASYFLLAKTAISFDITLASKDLNLCKTLTHVLKTLPCYCSTIVFRVLAFSHTTAYLRYYAVVPIFILFLELFALNYLRLKNEEFDNGYEMALTIYSTAIVNAGVLTVSNGRNLRKTRVEDANKYMENDLEFIRLSSIITFLHHTVVLTIIVVMASINPEYLIDEEHFVVLRWMPDSNEFYWPFGITFLFGVVSTVLSLMLAPIIVGVDVGA